jgi:hypothetical protein
LLFWYNRYRKGGGLAVADRSIVMAAKRIPPPPTKFPAQTSAQAKAGPQGVAPPPTKFPAQASAQAKAGPRGIAPPPTKFPVQASAQAKAGPRGIAPPPTKFAAQTSAQAKGMPPFASTQAVTGHRLSSGRTMIGGGGKGMAIQKMDAENSGDYLYLHQKKFEKSIGTATHAYHVTNTDIAKMIKLGGFTTAYGRTGKRKAQQGGAFWTNKQKTYAKTLQNNIDQMVRDVVKAGYGMELITAFSCPPSYESIAFEPTAHPDDHLKVADRKEASIMNYIRGIDDFLLVEPLSWEPASRTGSLLGVLPPPPKIATIRNVKISESHYLYLLAKDLTDMKYDIEEAITSTHTYFAFPGNEETVMSDYEKKVSGIPVRLRADISSMRGSFDVDMADFSAVKTNQAIDPSLVQIWDKDIQGWVPLGTYDKW